MPPITPLAEYRITDHAWSEMRRRGISEADIAQVLSSPGQIRQVRTGRVVYQSRLTSGAPAKTHLLRVFVDVDRHPSEVVKAYRTSKIDKYWQSEP